MVEYLDKIGLTYLWGKLKTLLNGKVDKVSSTDNAIARFDGTSGSVQNSVATINDSGHVTAPKFVTSNGSSSQVVTGDGSLKSIKELPVGEAYLTWGGKNFNYSYGPIDAAMVPELGACRTMFAKAQGIVIEYSRDGGETWIDYGASDSNKTALFSTGSGFVIGKNSSASETSAQHMLRVTLRTSSIAANVYTKLNKFVIYVSTDGSTGSYCTIRCRLQKDYVDGTDNWKVLANKVSISGWPGYNVINVAAFSTYGNSSSNQYGEVQFIFGCTGVSSTSYTGLRVFKIFGFGGVGWNTPSKMAKTGHLYDFDSEQNAIFPANVIAVSLKKSGGTSNQFLKADGSVDETSYLPENGNAASATKATQDGSGNNIEATYQKKADVPAAITNAEMDSVLEDNTEVETTETNNE